MPGDLPWLQQRCRAVSLAMKGSTASSQSTLLRGRGLVTGVASARCSVLRRASGRGGGWPVGDFDAAPSRAGQVPCGAHAPGQPRGAQGTRRSGRRSIPSRPRSAARARRCASGSARASATVACGLAPRRASTRERQLRRRRLFRRRVRRSSFEVHRSLAAKLATGSNGSMTAGRGGRLSCGSNWESAFRR